MRLRLKNILGLTRNLHDLDESVPPELAKNIKNLLV
jgi:hypothetical protein